MFALYKFIDLGNCIGILQYFKLGTEKRILVKAKND